MTTKQDALEALDWAIAVLCDRSFMDGFRQGKENPDHEICMQYPSVTDFRNAKKTLRAFITNSPATSSVADSSSTNAALSSQGEPSDVTDRGGELLPCPFCGGEAEIRGDDAPENWVHCKANCQPTGRNKELLIKAWNTRAPSSQIPPKNEHIKPMCSNIGDIEKVRNILETITEECLSKPDHRDKWVRSFVGELAQEALALLENNRRKEND